jgi:hypothetical protein
MLAIQALLLGNINLLGSDGEQIDRFVECG